MPLAMNIFLNLAQHGSFIAALKRYFILNAHKRIFMLLLRLILLGLHKRLINLIDCFGWLSNSYNLTFAFNLFPLIFVRYSMANKHK